MSVSRVKSAQTNLLSVYEVSVETDLSRGLYSFSVVGLPDKAVEEAKDRVGAAVKNSGLTSPKQKNQKIVISLAPAAVEKQGPAFDLPIALSYLLAAEETNFEPEGKLFLGELSLDGTLRGIHGVLPVARFAKEKGFKELFVPKENAKEAALIDGIDVYGASSLDEVLKHLSGEKKVPKTNKTTIAKSEAKHGVDFADVRGQERAKRGLLIAAAGGHNVAMYGPPGTGKTMLAKAFAGILPPLSFDEMLEATSIYSVAGALSQSSHSFVTEPPFRSPHHTASYVSLVGGGVNPKPGEITLAHRGVLFLDEFPEFERRVIESLRQPLEDKIISISRAKGTARFPADIILIAAMNPCPCGNFGFRGKPCICSPGALQRYRRKMSGPIVDRIDIWLEVDRVLPRDLSEGPDGAASHVFRKQVASARERGLERFKKGGNKISKNSEMSARDIVSLVPLTSEVRQTLNMAAERLGMSPRVYHRMLKVARTIADLDESDEVKREHILEAVEYRPKKFDM